MDPPSNRAHGTIRWWERLSCACTCTVGVGWVPPAIKNGYRSWHDVQDLWCVECPIATLKNTLHLCFCGGGGGIRRMDPVSPQNPSCLVPCVDSRPSTWGQKRGQRLPAPRGIHRWFNAVSPSPLRGGYSSQHRALPPPPNYPPPRFLRTGRWDLAINRPIVFRHAAVETHRVSPTHQVTELWKR